MYGGGGAALLASRPSTKNIRAKNAAISAISPTSGQTKDIYVANFSIRMEITVFWTIPRKIRLKSVANGYAHAQSRKIRS
ncbi:hypothetical protein P4H94_14785 [Paenibacillus macerans]|uniref:Uncharacterized protein n=1 Tax=Paenibacillus macerans TaxID=44252 RepID=A0A6N8F529_PAEMA|nr:hypothetical protein [Paenibacillus macerans]MDU5946662.1 hypothetical protein [Paenibacillus macerans]MEC0138124.1 hypothetical protein [Paenibacillus macerans]MUG25542.1 hypothetical protein [Paenibacillus macerans]UMV47170.1 hypothetical protein LMZ02_27535 [Paenibacillus macerans]